MSARAGGRAQRHACAGEHAGKGRCSTEKGTRPARDTSLTPHSRPSSPLPPRGSLGYHLLRLLRFYGAEFNAATTVVSAEARRFLAKPAQASTWDPVSVPDPSDERENVGRNAFRFFQCQAVFRDACQALSVHAAAHPPR